MHRLLSEKFFPLAFGGTVLVIILLDFALIWVLF